MKNSSVEARENSSVDLHSSMDRFEEAIAKNMDNEEFNLHSSMDRFEVK